MTDAASFAKLVPGFDFLQGLVKNAGSAMPNMGQWIAPTLDPVELDRRIQELKTVQFWLEQNARMISTTVQALEVQRMTLATLQGMNVSVGSLQEAMKIQMPVAAPAAAPAPAPAAPLPQGDEDAPPAGVVDPMQWWNALTQQFTQLASNAMQAAGDAAQAAQSAAQTAAQTAASAATATANATVAAAAAAAAPVAEAAAAKKVSKAVPRKRAV